MTTAILSHLPHIPFLNPAPTKPVVGISGANIESQSVQKMIAQVRAAGGIPMVLANHASRNAAEDIEKIDTLIVMGNDFDIDPNRYINRYAENDPRRRIHPATQSAANDAAAAARAAYEEQLLALAASKKMPTLGICGGMHLINVMQGGGILQHIPDQIGDDHHMQSKEAIPGFCPVVPVTIAKDSTLGSIAGKTHTIYTPSFPPPNGEIGTTQNSFHHQAIDPDMVGSGLRIVASSDSYKNVQGAVRRLPEAIEPDPSGALKDWPMIAVQWHPECGDSNVSAALIADTLKKGSHYAAHSPRDRSRDEMAAMAANLRSAKKPVATLAESYAARLGQATVGRA